MIEWLPATNIIAKRIVLSIVEILRATIYTSIKNPYIDATTICRTIKNIPSYVLYYPLY